jgi:glycosyltransferase involved in cell wall biosynthesis
VIAISHTLKDHIVHSYRLKPENVSVVYNGVDEDFFTICSEKTFKGTLNILYTGRLHSGKGIFRLVKEFAGRKNIKANFYLAGQGPDFEKIQKIAENDTRIKLTGHLEKDTLKKLMSRTSIFLFPTLHEGCPNSLLEAMASGHACISYDIPVLREIIGDGGLLVPVNSPAAMCNELELLLGSPDDVQALALKAHLRAREFSWENCAKGLEQEFVWMANHSGK